MKNYIDDVEDKYDSIICHLLRSSQYLPNKFRGKKILEMTDLQSLAYQQLINQLSILNPLKYIYIIEKLLVDRYEKKIFTRFDNLVFVSKKYSMEAKKKTSKNDMEDIKISKATTQSGFKKNSFIYEFMISMRQKIDDPLGERAKKRKEIMKR